MSIRPVARPWGGGPVRASGERRRRGTIAWFLGRPTLTAHHAAQRTWHVQPQLPHSPAPLDTTSSLLGAWRTVALHAGSGAMGGTPPGRQPPHPAAPAAMHAAAGASQSLAGPAAQTLTRCSSLTRNVRVMRFGTAGDGEDKRVPTLHSVAAWPPRPRAAASSWGARTATCTSCSTMQPRAGGASGAKRWAGSGVGVRARVGVGVRGLG